MPNKILEKISPKLIKSCRNPNKKRIKDFQEDTKFDFKRKKESRWVRLFPRITREFGKKLILDSLITSCQTKNIIIDE